MPLNHETEMDGSRARSQASLSGVGRLEPVEPASSEPTSAVPPASSSASLARMKRQRRRDTRPEVVLRRLLHARGLRYRIDRPALKDSRRRHDLVFGSARVAVEVRGCFWHLCPNHGTLPKTNDCWWAAKLARNVARDEDTARRLAAAGWVLVVVWEHEDPDAAAERVVAAVTSGRGRRRRISLS